jgi:hypothetical protein
MNTRGYLVVEQMHDWCLLKTTFRVLEENRRKKHRKRGTFLMGGTRSILELQTEMLSRVIER